MESDVAISKLFDKLKDKLDTEIILKTHAVWKIPQINENSTLGQQIKYYRRLANIKQADLAKELGYDAIHDTVHEMCKDEARHGKGFEGLLKRYFG